MQFIKISVLIFSLLGFACRQAEKIRADEPGENKSAHNSSVPTALAPPLQLNGLTFAYPIGERNFITEAKDSDLWYNAQDFGENRHLGEDWNKNTGGNTDCGETVYAAADGEIVFASDAGAGWGNVIIIEHTSSDGSKVETLYGHLQTMKKTAGAVKKREPIGTVGNANNRYFCHLHFEIRTSACPFWNQPGVGYGDNFSGWLEPSEFIDRHR